MAPRVKVEGIKELQAALRELDKALPRELRKANLSVAREVTDQAKERASSVKGGARLVRGLFAVAQQRSAGVQIRDGGNTAGAFGYEFGAKKWRQFQPWLGSGEYAGYAMWPAIRDAEPELPERYAEALDPLLRRAFPK